ncbi:MAG: TIM barrel protein [Cyclobacteriaceae bacterium]|nr:TIM barrel protein [Cyclobacteriaceae bacterium]
MKTENDIHVSVFSKHLQWLDFENTAEVLKNAGFNGIDYTVRKGGHISPENVKKDLPRAIKAARRKGMEVKMITTGISSLDDEKAREILEVAASEGVAFYRMGYYHYQKELHPLKSIEKARAALSRLSDFNEKVNITGSYQNHAGRYIGAPVWDLHHLFEGINPAATGIQYDIRHAVVEGGISWQNGLELIAPWINTLAIKDFVWENKGDRWQAVSIPLGQSGMVDYPAFLNIIQQKALQLPMSIHYEYPVLSHTDMQLPEMEKMKISTEVMQKDLMHLKQYVNKTKQE